MNLDQHGIDPQKTLDHLKANWSSFSQIARGEHLSNLVGAGMSRRQIAKALDIAEGTVRRGLRLASLTPILRDQVLSGASGNKALLAQLYHERLLEQFRQRNDRWFREAAIVAATALIFRWLQHIGLHRSYWHQLFDEVRLWLDSRGHWALQMPAQVKPICWGSHPAEWSHVLQACPPVEQFEFQLAHFAAWMIGWLPSVAADRAALEQCLLRAAPKYGCF